MFFGFTTELITTHCMRNTGTMEVQMYEHRDTGRTAKQMLGAPKGAVFIWCNQVLHYPRMLARKHGRSDLLIVAPSWLMDARYCGKEFKAIIPDHALILTGDEGDLLQRHLWSALARVRPSL